MIRSFELSNGVIVTSDSYDHSNQAYCPACGWWGDSSSVYSTAAAQGGSHHCAVEAATALAGVRYFKADDSQWGFGKVHYGVQAGLAGRWWALCVLSSPKRDYPGGVLAGAHEVTCSVCASYTFDRIPRYDEVTG